MNTHEGVASHKAIRSIHTRLSRVEKEINKFLPDEDSEIVLKYKLAHQEIDSIGSKSRAIDIHNELERAWETIYRYNHKMNLEDKDVVIEDPRERLIIKHSIVNYIRDRIKLKSRYKGELKEILERLLKGDK